MGERYLIDTNVVIEYLSASLPKNGTSFLNKIIDSTPHISIITKIELLGFNTSKEEYKLLELFCNNAVVFDLTSEVVTTTIKLRQQNKIKIPDAIIAATAIENRFILLTRNLTDFKNVKGLHLFDPHSI